MNSPVDSSSESHSDVLKCTGIELETHNCKTYTFRSQNAINYIPGQYGNFVVNINGKEAQRTWTISSAPDSPTDNKSLSITVKRKEGGLVSNWLFEHLNVNDTISLTGIEGNFTLEKLVKSKGRKILFIAAGSGITPFISIIRSLASAKQQWDINLLYTAKTFEDFAFLNELQEVSNRCTQKVRVLFNTTQKQDAGAFFHGRLTKEALSESMQDLMERDVAVCGPQLYMEHIHSLLETLNFPPDRFSIENFDY